MPDSKPIKEAHRPAKTGSNKEKEWKLARTGPLAETYKNNPESWYKKHLTAEAFAGKEKGEDTVRVLVCIDEGTADLPEDTLRRLLNIPTTKRVEVIAMAGSGILFDQDNYENSITLVAEWVNEHQVDIVTYHGACGAGGIKVDRDQALAKKHVSLSLSEEQPAPSDTLAQDFAESVKEKAGGNVKAALLPANEMTRPSDLHTAVGAVYDLTGRFQPGRLPEHHSAFLVSRGAVGEAAKKELEIAIDIALDHGFKEYFTPENPFLITVMYEGGNNELKQMQEEIETIKAQLKPEDRDRIEVIYVNVTDVLENSTGPEAA